MQKGCSYTAVDGIRGRGECLGLTLATGVNGNNTCWVEGEARMYIDDDVYPSIHYTGTEDDFTGSCGFGNDTFTSGATRTSAVTTAASTPYWGTTTPSTMASSAFFGIASTCRTPSISTRPSA